jgi:hypothetical protein
LWIKLFNVAMNNCLCMFTVSEAAPPTTLLCTTTPSPSAALNLSASATGAANFSAIAFQPLLLQ